MLGASRSLTWPGIELELVEAICDEVQAPEAKSL